MTVPVNVSFRLDWIQVLKQCYGQFPPLNRGSLLALFFDTKLMAKWLSVIFTVLPVSCLMEKNGRRVYFLCSD